MKTWMKIGIGCLALSVIAVFLLVAGLVGFGYWAKSRVEEITGGAAVEGARKVANAIPFIRPEGGRVGEARLVKFIEVRASVFSVYEKYRGEIENRVARVKEGRSVELSDISTGLTLMGELQKTEAFALAKHGMSEDEYAFIASEVHKSMWTDFAGAEVGTKAINDTALASPSAEVMKSVAGSLPPDARDAMARAGAEIEPARTAPENAVLFKKYEADLKKYAMPGLNILIQADRPRR